MSTLPDVPVGSLHSDGTRNYVHPADVKGRFTRRRHVIFGILILLLVGLPFVRIGGHPALFLDVQHRLFYLFGESFNAQDFWLSFFLFTGFGFALFVGTTLWGRVWCGYACPQTVFLEGLYRPIERFIEGPRNQRLRRNAGPRTFARLWRKTAKHLLSLTLSIFLSHVFLTYFVSLPGMWAMVGDGPGAHMEAFSWVMSFALVLYFNFAWFREQTCLIVCPYGRLQSALIDADSLVIGYDETRGEPRGKASNPESGDCVNCNRCVVVCPTGIDIRAGLQIECIGCAACVDACDEIMTKLERPVGLIRYDSLNGFVGKVHHLLRPRLFFYAFLGIAGLVAASIAFSSRTSFEANALRSSNTAFVISEGMVVNSLRIHLINKRDEAVTYRVAGNEDALEYILPIPEARLASQASTYIPVMVRVPEAEMAEGLTIRLEVVPVGAESEVEVLTLPFVGPTSRRD